MRGKPTVVELFAGAGGLSSSLEAAGWRSVAAVDNDADAIETFHNNKKRGFFKGTKLIHADIRDVGGKCLRPDNATPRWQPDLLAGGPPCQPFSSAGSMRGIDDPRGQLFQQFVRLARELKPRFILFENVAGLVTAKTPDGRVGGVLRRIQRDFEEIGYGCRFDLLNAADYGAPQRRVRLYMIAARNERLPEFPPPTHSREPSLERAPWITLGQFLSQRPMPDPADVVRPAPSRADALSKLVPGTGLRSNGIVEANRPSGHWGYRQDCFLADTDVPSRTIRAATTPDWLRIKSGDMRRLTWRECAALQGFPDNWEFAGNIGSRFRQIGNAVQGHIGCAIGTALQRAAMVAEPASATSAGWPPSFHKRVRYTAMEEVVNGAHRRAAKERTNVAIATALV